MTPHNDLQNVRLMMMFDGENLLLMSHCVFGKYAVGVPQASVLTSFDPLQTSCGTLGA
jgi:hypothetical protein